MNVNVIELFIKELSSDGFLKENDYKYILTKASELNVSSDFVNEYLATANIKIIYSEVQSSATNNSDDFFSTINKDIRLKFSRLGKENMYAEIVHIFESKYFNTNDTFLIESYLNALNQDYPEERTYKQAKIFYDKFPQDKRILNIFYQITMGQRRYSEALDLLFQLNKLGESDQQKIDNVLSLILDSKNWSLFGKYSQTKNFGKILNGYLDELAEYKNDKGYVELFDQCEYNYSEKQYELYAKALLNLGRYDSVKSVCLKMLSKSNLPIFNAYMGIACENSGKYHDAVFYYEKAVLNGLNYTKNLSDIKNIIRELELESERKAERKTHEEKMRQMEEEENIRKGIELEKQMEQEDEEQDSRNRLKIEEEKSIGEENNRNKNSNLVNSRSNMGRVEFTSAVTRGGDIINPDVIIIDDGNVTWKKRSKILISGQSISIPLDKVASVDLQFGVIGTNIIIRSNGMGSIHAEYFTKSDAQEIKKLLGF